MTPNIYGRIHEVMQLVERVTKDRMNKHGGYYYVGHDDVTLALRKAFVKCGLVQTVELTQVERKESGAVGVHVLVRWTLPEDPGQYIVVPSYGEAQAMDKKGAGTPQQIGIALSFAVKLAQLKNFCLVGDDTPDPEQFSEPPPNVERKQAPASAPSNGEPSKAETFALAFKACTTMKRYDEVLAKAAGIVKTCDEETRRILVAAANEAKKRILDAEKAEKTEALAPEQEQSK